MRIIRSGLIVCICLLIVLGGAACREEQSGKRIRIGFLLKTMQEERYKRDREIFIRKVKSLGAEVVFDSANNDEQIQMAKFENMLAKKCSVIVLQPVNTGTAGNMVSMAHNEGVRVVGYDSMIQNGPLDLMVMQDSWAVGTLQGKAMLKWFMEKKGRLDGDIALIMGQPGDSNVNAMSSGVIEIIESFPGLRLVAQQSHEGWSPDKAMATAENILTKYNNRVDAFVCNNSGLCRGVIAALDTVGRANADMVFTAGSDADLTNIKYVAQGKQTVEIWKKIQPLAEGAASAAVVLAENPDTDVKDLVQYDKMIFNGYSYVPTIVTEIVLVTRDNIEETVIEGGFYTYEQIYE
ncbi:MAG: substrate-binding domain-containing protein [Spirochaetota bacterium]